MFEGNSEVETYVGKQISMFNSQVVYLYRSVLKKCLG